MIQMYHSHCTYKFYQSLVLLLFFLRNLFLFYENETVVNLWICYAHGEGK